MAGDQLPKRLTLNVAVLDYQIIAGRKIFVEVLQHAPDIVMGVFNDEPGMRRAAKEFRIEQVCRIGAISLQIFDTRMLPLDFDPVDGVNAAFDAAKRQMIGEPNGARSQT